jgi:hypothetical protein
VRPTSRANRWTIRIELATWQGAAALVLRVCWRSSPWRLFFWVRYLTKMRPTEGLAGSSFMTWSTGMRILSSDKKRKSSMQKAQASPLKSRLRDPWQGSPQPWQRLGGPTLAKGGGTLGKGGSCQGSSSKVAYGQLLAEKQTRKNGRS